jgi:hypothetical protein
VKVYVVVKQDYEGGSDGHEYAPNTEILGVFQDRDAAWALAHKEYDTAVEGAGSEEDVTVGFEVEEHELQ